MTRRKGRANGPTGLWRDTPDQPYVPAHDLRIEQEISPLTRACEYCGAAAGQRCTRPARNGRTDLRGWHPSRLNEPENPCPATKTPPSPPA